MSLDMLSFGVPFGSDQVKVMITRFSQAFGLSTASTQVLGEKIDCFGKTEEEVNEIRQSRSAEKEKESWLGGFNLSNFWTGGLQNKTSPKITPSKGEDNEDEPEVVEVVQEECSEQDLELLKEQNLISPSPLKPD